MSRRAAPLALALVLACAAAPALAAGPAFAPKDRATVAAYFDKLIAGGDCPPDLAASANGCYPTTSERKWTLGEALNSEVTYYPLPGELLLDLPESPDGMVYVRVGRDILLVTLGDHVVKDAIPDFGAQRASGTKPTP